MILIIGKKESGYLNTVMMLGFWFYGSGVRPRNLYFEGVHEVSLVLQPSESLGTRSSNLEMGKQINSGMYLTEVGNLRLGLPLTCF